MLKLLTTYGAGGLRGKIKRHVGIIAISHVIAGILHLAHVNQLHAKVSLTWRHVDRDYLLWPTLSSWRRLAVLCPSPITIAA